MQMKISRKCNLNANLHLIQRCIIKTLIKNSSRVLCDIATEKYSNQTPPVWPKHHLHSIIILKRRIEI